jgi:hypothetical protein
VSAQRPTPMAAFYALVCIAFIVAGIFFVDEWTDRVLTVLFGLHFGNRCEIENLRARASMSHGEKQ